MNTPVPYLLLALLLASCGGPDKYAQNAAVPDLATTSEQPGDWSHLAQLIGRNPDESGLFEDSPITVDLNALLGPDLARFRQAMAGATPLVAEGPALVTTGASRSAFLVIVPDDHALGAGLKVDGGWRIFRTPGSEISWPVSVRALQSR